MKRQKNKFNFGLLDLPAVWLLTIFLCGHCLSAFAGTDITAMRKSKDFKTISTRIMKRIPLPRGYHEGLFYDGKSVWVANGKKGKVWVVDTSAGAITSTIEPVADFTEGITRDFAGNYFVTDWDDKKIYRIRITKDAMIADAESSVDPAHPAGIIWNGRYLLVIIWTRSLVGTSFDLLEMDEGLNLHRRIPIKTIQDPAQLAWDGRNLWITSWYSRLVYKIDIEKWEAVGAFFSPVSKPTGIAWDGRYLWLTGTHGDLYQVEVL